MAYQITDLYSSRHDNSVKALKSTDFPTTGDWKPIIEDARQAITDEGFSVSKYAASTGIRKQVESARKRGTKTAATMLVGAGASVPNTGSTAIPSAVAKRVAVLEVLRHLWLLKKSGSHKVWVLSLPEGYKDWPEAALDGKDFDAFSALVNDRSSHFSSSDKKHLSNATQEGIKWVQRAMIVAADPDKPKHQAILKRWFADANSTDQSIKDAAAALNAGLKKISAVMKSTFLLFVDMPMDRGNPDEANTNAYVFQNEKINVIYVEASFFNKTDTFKDLKNWTRIVVHELSHREVKTADHRYRHHSKGLKPDAADANFTAAHALANADSWAIFCMDCAGEMTKNDYKKVKVT